MKKKCVSLQDHWQPNARNQSPDLSTPLRASGTSGRVQGTKLRVGLSAPSSLRHGICDRSKDWRSVDIADEKCLYFLTNVKLKYSILGLQHPQAWPGFARPDPAWPGQARPSLDWPGLDWHRLALCSYSMCNRL